MHEDPEAAMYKNVDISKDIFDDPQLRPRIERASELLEQIIGPASNGVTVKCMRDVPDFIHLDLADSTGATATTPFTANELTNENYLRARLYRVWGDLLQDRSHRQLQVLLGSSDAPGR
jgi:hypothetical protein